MQKSQSCLAVKQEKFCKLTGNISASLYLIQFSPIRLNKDIAQVQMKVNEGITRDTNNENRKRVEQYCHTRWNTNSFAWHEKASTTWFWLLLLLLLLPAYPVLQPLNTAWNSPHPSHLPTFSPSILFWVSSSLKFWSILQHPYVHFLDFIICVLLYLFYALSTHLSIPPSISQL